MSQTSPRLSFVFFGTDAFSIGVLEELKKANLLPQLIVTAPARRRGRGMELHQPPVKDWADTHAISTLQPEKLDADFITEIQAHSPKDGWPVFALASYGKIVPQEVLDIPKNGILNVHPSLLPKYRGASPIQSQILTGEERVGVTLMLMDDKMDHGPIVVERQLANSKFEIQNLKKEELEEELAREGGLLLAEILPEWVAGKIEARHQNHTEATFTQKITKADGEIDTSDDSLTNWRKFLAYTPWPGIFFFRNNKRIKVTDASFEDGAFVIKKVVPEGKKEIDWVTFARNIDM